MSGEQAWADGSHLDPMQPPGGICRGRTVSEPSEPRNRPARAPAGSGRRWTSFVATDNADGRPVRGLHEQANPRHRLRVEHDAHTLLIHLTDEDGAGWTTVAFDRTTRQWAVAQDTRQGDTARAAFDALYDRPEVLDR